MAKSARARFAVCIDSSGYPASLERHKIYRVLIDRDAAQEGDLRVVDESGEDYLYEARRFVLVDFPASTVRVLNRSFAQAATNARSPGAGADRLRRPLSALSLGAVGYREDTLLQGPGVGRGAHGSPRRERAGGA